MIKINSVYKTYVSGTFYKRKFEALKNINIEIMEGKTVGLIGSSGSGKSTIAKILCGIESYNSGEITFENNVIEKGKCIDEINIIFQHPESSFDPRLTMYENLVEILNIKKLYSNENKYKIINEYIKLVGLKEELLKRHVNEISGGEAQRFVIARALMTKSKFLILDECTSMLDVFTQAQILNLLINLQKEKKLTYLFISHDLEVAKIMCDYIYILKDGEIVEKGNVEKIFENPKNEYTKNLIEIFNKLNI